jgi:ABC-type sulfate transport system permease component
VLGEADGDTFLPGLGLLFLVQAERLYESLVAPLSGILAFAGLAVLVAQLALLILLAVVYVRSLLKARRGEL